MWSRNGFIINYKKMKQITENEFNDKFTIRPNHIVDREEFGGMYETYGEEAQYIRDLTCSEKRVWTIIEADGYICYVTGYHYVNRIGYFVTNEEYHEDMEVKLMNPSLDLIDLDQAEADAMRIVDTKDYDNPEYRAFMQGIVYAENQIKDLPVEFVNWIYSNEPQFTQWVEAKINAEELLEQFLMEKR